MIRRVTIRVRGRSVYDSEDDPLAAARGILNALLIMVGVYALLFSWWLS